MSKHRNSYSHLIFTYQLTFACPHCVHHVLVCLVPIHTHEVADVVEEAITVLKSGRQRLIYRRRLISSGCIASTNASTSTNEAAAAVTSSITAGMLPSEAGRSVSAISATTNTTMNAHNEYVTAETTLET